MTDHQAKFITIPLKRLNPFGLKLCPECGCLPEVEASVLRRPLPGCEGALPDSDIYRAHCRCGYTTGWYVRALGLQMGWDTIVYELRRERLIELQAEHAAEIIADEVVDDILADQEAEDLCVQ
jgi:hypothetical protein